MENNDLKYVVTIIHGSKEHIGRYSEFIKELNSNGIEVESGDLATHGENFEEVEDDEGNPIGYHNFSFQQMLDSALEIIDRARENYPDHKHILFGHSMGSFIAKAIVYTNARKFDGVILSGTNNPSNLAVRLGIMINSIGDKNKVSTINENLSYGALSISSKMHGYGKNWLSEDEDNVKAFEEDELCGRDFSKQSLRAMLTFIKVAQKKKVLKKFENKEIPQLLLSGSRDPVSHYGKHISKMIKKQKRRKIKNHISKIYFAAKHEILFDTSKELVTKDIVEFIKNKVE